MTARPVGATPPSPYSPELKREHTEADYFTYLDAYRAARNALFSQQATPDRVVAYLRAAIDVMIKRTRILNMRISQPVRISRKKKAAPDYFQTRRLDHLYRLGETATRRPQDRPRFYDAHEAEAALRAVFDKHVPEVDRVLMGKSELDRHQVRHVAEFVRDTWLKGDGGR